MDGIDVTENDDEAGALVALKPSLRCRLGWHTAMPSNVWNDGHYFSACERCKISLIRTPQENWHPVPRNYRIVWRRRTDEDIVWPTTIF